MSLSKIKKMQEERGFTIVELLIVIIVIGILAAIIIVAYNGITTNAKNSGFKSDAESIKKIAEVVNAERGAYPTGSDSATLTTSFNQTATSDIPPGISITYLASGGTAPTNAAAQTSAEANPKNYTVRVCAGGGVQVYYPVINGAIADTVAGTCP